MAIGSRVTNFRSEELSNDQSIKRGAPSDKSRYQFIIFLFETIN